MNPLKIQEIVNNIKEDLSEKRSNNNNIVTEEIKVELNEKYKDFSLQHPVIFLSIVNETLDYNQFNKMVDMACKVKDNKISQHDASVKVGSELVDKYVKPKIDNIEKS